MMRQSVVRGVGSWLPKKVVTNDDLSRTLETSDEWIRQRTGIAQRHIAGEEELASDLAYRAAQRALENAELEANDIDIIVMATVTPDHSFPATATRLQGMLGITQGVAWDLQAACSGYIYALTQVDNALRLRQGKRALVVGAEVFSRILDWTDRSTCVLFGDGAGAVVLEAVEVSEDDPAPRGILSSVLRSDGRYYDLLRTSGGVGSTQTAGYALMAGKEVFRHAVHAMSESVEQALEKAGLSLSDVDWLVPHQANARIITKVGESLDIDPAKVVVTVDKHANVSAATIPLAMTEAAKRNSFKTGDVLALTAMGGGFTWGAMVLRW